MLPALDRLPQSIGWWLKQDRRLRCLRLAGPHPVSGEAVYRDGSAEAPFFRAGDLLLVPATATTIVVRDFAELLEAGRAPGIDRWEFARAAEVLAAEVR